MLQAASRVADGQVPYADFRWPYGTAQQYDLYGKFELFGASLLHWRVLRVLVVALTALVVFVLVRRAAGTRLALVAWLVAACVLAQPANASPFPVALLLALLAVAVLAGPESERRHALLAGLLAGLAATWRLDLGVVLAYLPFVVAAGPADLYDELIGISMREGGYWTLPFPLGYDGPLRSWPPGDLASDLKDVLGFYLPLVAMAGLVVGVAALAAGAWQRRTLEPVEAGMLVLALAGAAYLVSRTDEFHSPPLVLALAVLLALAVARAPRPLAVAAAGGLALFMLYGAANRLSALFLAPATDRVDVPVADGVRAPPAEARAIERMVAEVQRRVPPGQPIYVVPRRSDLVAFESPMVYVLTQRPNPSRDDVALRARPAAQTRMVRALRGARPRVVVRWTDPLSVRREPNRRGRSSGVRTLDAYLAREYRTALRLRHYTLLEPL